jgi:hypothetical protein
MNGVPLREGVARANSHLRYWRYRRAIGRPFPLSVALREWWARLLFECRRA